MNLKLDIYKRSDGWKFQSVFFSNEIEHKSDHKKQNKSDTFKAAKFTADFTTTGTKCSCEAQVALHLIFSAVLENSDLTLAV